MTREGKIATVLLILFGLMLSPPIVFWVNTDALLFGWAFMFLWALGWAFFAVAVLAWATMNEAFSINDSQVPPEIVADTPAIRREETPPTGEPTGGDD